jgi:choline dehydrogenase-like flavoprotein
VSSERDAAAYAEPVWDVIVVGTGVGGATAGYALAKAGKRVLFCERGAVGGGEPSPHAGRYPEQDVAGDASSDRLLGAAGRFAGEIFDQSTGRMRRFVPFIGSAVGGSSALYGMALERFQAADFMPGPAHRSAPGSSLPQAWPITYDELAPYYTEAEALFKVRGTKDPLREGGPHEASPQPPPPLTEAAQALSDFLSGKGLHPYRLPLACEFVPECQCCQGYLCPRPCKNDSQRICITPATTSWGATLMTGCDVTRIESKGSQVSGLVCRWRGRTLRLRARLVVLAAGALQTPNLLMRSASSDWPEGLGNRSGLVGRNLMRHFIDLYVLRSEKRPGQPKPDNRFKELAFNDFYRTDRAPLGSVQSFGRLPPVEMLYDSLRQDLRDGPLPWVAGLLPCAAPFLKRELSGMVDDALVLATTLEDLPYAGNRVQLAEGALSDTSAIRMHYAIAAYDRERIAEFRRVMKATLEPKRMRLVKQAENNQRLAHACGTCRFGTDPTTSVLDAHNRVHDLDNLFVVDSSFFPSSGGTNPSLTVAANALRVAHALGR